MKDNLYTEEKARDGLINGIRKCREAVGGTMGTGGANSIIEAIANPGYMVTNDGASILNAIKLSDPLEELGRKILVEAVSRANKQSGDGSSTATVLTAAIIEEGVKHTEISPLELRASIESCLPLIEEAVNKQRRYITVDEVGQVAAISAEDAQIGQTIQEIYQEIGKDGIIHWDISKTFEDSYTIGKGITIDWATFVSPYMCDASESGQNTNQIRIKNPKILVTKQKITNANEFNELAQALYAQEVRDLVVFCDEYEPLIITDLIKTRALRGFRIILVKLPTLWKDEWYDDLSLTTGAKIVDPNTGLPMKSVKVEDLGTVENIHITKEATYLDGIKDVQGHIKDLQAEASESAVLRASRLNTKTARYFVGAPSESALSYRRLKVEDAISAGWQALQGGVVIGGGLVLATIADKLPNEVLKIALKAPYEQIKKNMGGKAFTMRDMVEQKVYDPAPVVLNSVRNAVSVAAAVLTANTAVLLPREEPQLLDPRMVNI